jgi:hypothetical protein
LDAEESEFAAGPISIAVDLNEPDSDALNSPSNAASATAA